MKRIPKKYNSEQLNNVLVVSARRDKKGDFYYLVEFRDEEDNMLSYVSFEKLSSVIDFIKSNFR